MKRIFKNHKGEPIEDIISYINEYKKVTYNVSYEIFIGCDSQVNKTSTMYSVVIGIHKMIGGVGRGVHLIHTRERDKKLGEAKSEIYKRLWSEVERILETAVYLQEHDISDIEIHIDANGSKKYKSNMIYDSSLGMFSGMGFRVNAKPEAWAATYAANRYCR